MLTRAHSLGPLDRHGMETLDIQSCFTFLAGERIGRIGVVIDEVPMIFPVNYSLFAGQLLFYSVEGSKLDAMIHGGLVSLEVDRRVDPHFSAISVLVIGRVREAAHGVSGSAMGTGLPYSWLTDARRLMCLTPVIVSGRRIPHDLSIRLRSSHRDSDRPSSASDDLRLRSSHRDSDRPSPASDGRERWGER